MRSLLLGTCLENAEKEVCETSRMLNTCSEKVITVANLSHTKPGKRIWKSKLPENQQDCLQNLFV